MRVLTYAGLDVGKWEGEFEKIVAALERNDFRSADVKKLGHGGYYRAKLDYANRLLLQFVEHKGEKACLALELIEGHAYDRSRFLRGATVDESRIEPEPPVEPTAVDAAPVRYLHPERRDFFVQSKPISFDDAQARIHATPPPLLLVGTAGSGKTALTLEKLRLAEGALLYVTQSAYLAESARSLYFAHGYENDAQAIDFMSYRELLESIRVPAGRPIAFRDFRAFFERHRHGYKLADAQRTFEEIRGVLGAQPEGPLSLDAYLSLGVRQSSFSVEERRAVFAVFERYRAFLGEAGLYDSNFVAQAYLPTIAPRYDLVVVDEAQDLTNAELALVLALLAKPERFVLAGDANQIVHPNFFSWSGVKQLFFRDPALAERQRIELLDVNFRNARSVTRVANRLLKIKQARFGSIDRESNTLVRPVADDEGAVEILPADDRALAELDGKIARSAQFAVLVLRDEHKAEAKRRFRTPLVFSVHEAKGLEYDSVVLYRFVSSERASFAEVCDGVERADADGDDLPYRRAKDKSDKSLEAYKFYTNGLYVALTRAVRRAFLVEEDAHHPLLKLLDVRPARGLAAVEATASSLEEWQREARRLELQGKDEQAEAIRRTILRIAPVPWTVIDEATYGGLLDKALAPRSPFTKAKQQLYSYACIHELAPLAGRLADDADFAQARQFERDAPAALDKALAPYLARKPDEVLSQVARHGADFRSPAGLTPLMLAAVAGNAALMETLIERGARRELTDPFGRTAAHWALWRGYRSAAFARAQLGAVWEKCAPNSIDVRCDERLFKIGREQGEHFYLMAMMTLWPNLLRHRYGRPMGVKTAMLLAGGFAAFPPNVVKPERKRRAYLSHLFARNEVNSNYRPNRKLWLRERHGEYVPNPALLLRIAAPGPAAEGVDEPEWRSIREALGEQRFVEHWFPWARARVARFADLPFSS